MNSPVTPEPSAPKQARSQERRRALTKLASRLISERGFEALSVNEMADALGISIGGLYRYIKTKSDLLVMACEDIYGDLRESIMEVVTGSEPIAEKLRRAMLVYLNACEENRDLILLMYREYRHLPVDARRRYQDREEAIAGVFCDLLVSGMRQGQLRSANADVLSRDIIFLGHLPALKDWSLRGRVERDQLVQSQVELILDRVLPIGAQGAR